MSMSLILIGLAMFLTLAVLAVGIFAMIKGGEFNEKYGNKLMQARVVFQGLAILFFVLAFVVAG